ncbi:hypothetical protein K3495_g4435 [Podosphaera aphanis]|nr:hypothetical protein K3495_g4435 [Podosphaera aphanis]
MSTKRKIPQKFGHPVVSRGVKTFGKGALIETNTVVSTGENTADLLLDKHDEPVLISSDSSSGDEKSSDEDSADEGSVTGLDITMKDSKLLKDPIAPEDVEMLDGPSFGDIIRENASVTIDVTGAAEEPDLRLLAYPKVSIQPPSGASLGTVLSQALRTNDVSLLETCLHTSDVNSVRATIQRLDSSLAAKLLHKLSERLHRRPGRAGNLMVWVQWTLVAHGGYLATQKALMQSLAELTKVINGRSRSLQSVLALKGKLDMLEAQLELRKGLQNYRRRFDDDEEDERVIYVEVQDNKNEVLTDEDQRITPNGNLEAIQDEDSEASEDMPTLNEEVIANSEEDDDDDENSDNDGLIDDEAEEDDELEDEDEVNHDEKDSDFES